MPRTVSRRRKALVVALTSLGLTGVLATLGAPAASAAEKCRGGLFDGYSLITARDRQLCVEGGGTVEQQMVEQFPSWEYLTG